VKHRNCGKHKLRKISYVKQHILRNHFRSNHCQRCFEVFSDGPSLDRHVGSAAVCTRPPSAPEDWISYMQKDQLGRKARGKEDEQWFAVWEILFPGLRRPASPYMDADLSTDLQEFREYCCNRGPVLLMELLDSQQVWSMSREQRRLVCAAVLQRGLEQTYEDWWSRRSPNPAAAASRVAVADPSPPGPATATSVPQPLPAEAGVAPPPRGSAPFAFDHGNPQAPWPDWDLEMEDTSDFAWPGPEL